MGRRSWARFGKSRGRKKSFGCGRPRLGRGRGIRLSGLGRSVRLAGWLRLPRVRRKAFRVQRREAFRRFRRQAARRSAAHSWRCGEDEMPMGLASRAGGQPAPGLDRGQAALTRRRWGRRRQLGPKPLRRRPSAGDAVSAPRSVRAARLSRGGRSELAGGAATGRWRRRASPAGRRGRPVRGRRQRPGRRGRSCRCAGAPACCRRPVASGRGAGGVRVQAGKPPLRPSAGEPPHGSAQPENPNIASTIR